MLYSTAPGLLYFITASFYLLTIFITKIDKKLNAFLTYSVGLPVVCMIQSLASLISDKDTFILWKRP